jgi:hypothetical protein
MRSAFWKDCVVCLGLVALSVGGRLLAHVPNFTPVAAAALFAGYFVSRRSMAVAVPIVSMALSDLVIGGYDVEVMVAVYASMVLPVFLSMALKGRFFAARVFGCCLASSCFFFVVTNFAVWKFGGMYGSDWSGLLRCYLAALPFFKYTLGGDLFWCVGLFGCHALVTRIAGRFAKMPWAVLLAGRSPFSALAVVRHSPFAR